LENLVVVSIHAGTQDILYWVVVIRSVVINMIPCEVESCHF